MLTRPRTVKNALKPKTKGKFNLNLIEKGLVRLLVLSDYTQWPKTPPGEQLETHTENKKF